MANTKLQGILLFTEIIHSIMPFLFYVEYPLNAPDIHTPLKYVCNNEGWIAHVTCSNHSLNKSDIIYLRCFNGIWKANSSVICSVKNSSNGKIGNNSC